MIVIYFIRIILVTHAQHTYLSVYNGNGLKFLVVNRMPQKIRSLYLYDNTYVLQLHFHTYFSMVFFNQLIFITVIYIFFF